MDYTLLPMLGPWASCLGQILHGAEDVREDKLTPGIDLKHLGLGTMGGSFVVFRGVSLKQSQIHKWASIVGKIELDHWLDKGKSPNEIRR